MPTVRDIMTSNTVTISPASPIHVAVDLLLEKRISGLPVVDEAGRLVGILTEFALLAIAYDDRVSGDTVAQHMTTDVLTVNADDPENDSRVADSAESGFFEGQGELILLGEDGKGKLVVRIAAPSSYLLRKQLIPVIRLFLGDHAMPKVWNL